MPPHNGSFLLDQYENLDEVAAPVPVENRREGHSYRHQSLENIRSLHSDPDEDAAGEEYEFGDLSGRRRRPDDDLERHQSAVGPGKRQRSFAEREGDLTEVAAPSPVVGRSAASSSQSNLDRRKKEEEEEKEAPSPHERRSNIATQLYTISWLIFFSILGTLARLGLQALTFYKGAPVTFGVLWPNVGGSFIMGFLSEDRNLFGEEWGRTPPMAPDATEEDHAAAKANHGKVKKGLPLYIGLATGFCGSFTSFSSFIRDVFLALANELSSPLSHPYPSGVSSTTDLPRNGGYSFMALTAILLVTVALSVGALKAGAHLALFATPVTPTIRFRFARRVLDPLGVLLGFGCWLGAVFMAIWPPDRSWKTPAHETWRGQAIFALVFAPLGCLLRFYASVLLNARVPAFPLGTFAVNIFGTAIEAMCYDLQRVESIGASSIISCQVLQGVMDGFCGCLTTVSTWVAELNGLRRSHAYIYGISSVGVALGIFVVVSGSLLWTVGFVQPVCSS